MTNALLVTSIRDLRAQLLCEGFFRNHGCRMHSHQIQCSNKRNPSIPIHFQQLQSHPSQTCPAPLSLPCHCESPSLSRTFQFCASAHTHKHTPNPSQDFLVTDWPILLAAFLNLQSSVLCSLLPLDKNNPT